MTPTRRPTPRTSKPSENAIDALAVAAGLPQSMIDTAEGN